MEITPVSQKQIKLLDFYKEVSELQNQIEQSTSPTPAAN